MSWVPKVLESRALAEDTPPIPPDQTLPDSKRLAAASDVLQAFVAATFDEGIDAKPKAKAASKRKADGNALPVDVAEVFRIHWRRRCLVVLFVSTLRRRMASTLHVTVCWFAGRLGWAGRVRQARADDHS